MSVANRAISSPCPNLALSDSALSQASRRRSQEDFRRGRKASFLRFARSGNTLCTLRIYARIPRSPPLPHTSGCCFLFFFLILINRKNTGNRLATERGKVITYKGRIEKRSVLNLLIFPGGIFFSVFFFLFFSLFSCFFPPRRRMRRKRS